MKKILNLLATIAMAAFVFAACEPESNPTPAPPTPGPGTGNTDKPGDGGQTAELKADFTFEVDGLTVKFTNASTGATGYLWNFGDESTATDANPEHTYDAAGTYTVKLTVQDAAGTAKSVEKDVTVAGAVKAYFSATAKTDRAGKFGKIFAFDATSSENAASIAWDFGDGSEGSDKFTVEHEFPEFDKTYTVKATVTGQGGDVDTYESTITVVGYNELLKGGSMEADDAQYWTAVNHIYDVDWLPNVLGNPLFVHEWGAQNGPSGGQGGCLRLGGEGQEQYSLAATVYQAIELAEGDQIELSAQVKWNDNTVDNGVFSFFISQSEEEVGSGAILELFNYWSVDNNVTEGPKPSWPLPAWEGDLTGAGMVAPAESIQTDPGYNPANVTVTEDGKVIYTSTINGTAYFGFKVTNVWGNHWGAGCDYYIDEVSAKILL